MTITEQPATTVQVNKRMLVIGAGLIAVGAVIAAGGAVMSGLTVASAVRRWSQTLPTPPRELAQQRLNQAKVVRVAAVQAWRAKPDQSVASGDSA